MSSSSALIAELQKIFPAERLLLHEAALAPYESDGLTAFRQKPLGVVLPETQDEVVAAVKKVTYR